MAEVTVRIKGLAALRRDLKQLGGDAADLKAAHAAAGRIVAAAAAPRAPRSTGRLAASLRASQTVGKATVRSPVAYGVFQHWAPYGRPFISEAAQATEPVWLAAYMADLNRAVEKISGKTY